MKQNFRTNGLINLETIWRFSPPRVIITRDSAIAIRRFILNLQSITAARHFSKKKNETGDSTLKKTLQQWNRAIEYH